MGFYGMTSEKEIHELAEEVRRKREEREKSEE